MWRFCLIAMLLLGVSATPHGPVDIETLFAERTPFQDAMHAVERIQTDLDGVQYRLGLAYVAVCLGQHSDAMIRTDGAAAIMADFEARHAAAISRVWALAAVNPHVSPIVELAEWLDVLLQDAERLRLDTVLWVEAVNGLGGTPISEWPAAIAPLLEWEVSMTLPASGYDVFQVPNPTGDVTDYPFYIDLSLMSADWWAAVDTADATKGRAAINASETELPCEWKNFNSGTKTGQLYVKWSGVIGTTGTHGLRVYPPMAANASVAADATYGSQAVWSIFEGVWHLQDNFNDSTANGRNGTGQGGISAGGTAGKFGVATVFDGSDDHITLGDVLGSITRPMTFSAWVKTSATLGTYVGMRDGATTQWQWFSNSSGALAVNAPSGINATTAHNNNAWRHIAGSVASNGTVTFYLDGASDGSAGTANPSDQNIGVVIGARYATAPAVAALFNGAMQELRIDNAATASQWIAYDYANQSNASTFWGTPTWTPPPSSGTPYYYNLRRRAN